MTKSTKYFCVSILIPNKRSTYTKAVVLKQTRNQYVQEVALEGIAADTADLAAGEDKFEWGVLADTVVRYWGIVADTRQEEGEGEEELLFQVQEVLHQPDTEHQREEAAAAEDILEHQLAAAQRPDNQEVLYHRSSYAFVNKVQQTAQIQTRSHKVSTRVCLD